MIFHNGRHYKTQIDELDDREKLMLVRGLCYDMIEESLNEWMKSIDDEDKDSEKDEIWRQISNYDRIRRYCDEKLSKPEDNESK